MAEKYDVYLRQLTTADVSERYLSWLNDPEITRFLECRFFSYSNDQLIHYVDEASKSVSERLYGIFLSDGDRHVGNVKIGNIDWVHRFGDIGLLIGEKDLWGKGIGTFAIRIGTEMAFSGLNLLKLTAGVYSNNNASCRAFEKAGYSKAGVLKKHRFFEGTYIDQIIYEKLR